jgi:hypothetical protein
MRYDMKGFHEAVRYYKNKLGGRRTILIVFDPHNTRAYYSIAPLSRAVHETGGDVHCIGAKDKSDSLDVLYDTWLLNDSLRKGERSKATAALRDFLKRVKIPGFDGIFEKPDLILKASEDHFVGDGEIGFMDRWFRPYKTALLRKTARVIYSQVYNLKKGERTSVGFELILKKSDMHKPLEDYLDSYPLCRAMAQEAESYGEVTLSASTPRMSMLSPMNRIGDLRTTLLGCELSKKIDEPVFKAFRKLSLHIRSDRLKVADASFFVTGRGYGGKHMFGDKIGYPDPDRKTRWQTPGMFIYKLDYYPQTALDKRKPMSRVGFTDTLPIDLFIKTCNIDWFAMKKRDDILKRIAMKSERIIVRSDKAGSCDFEVGLVMKDGTHRWPRGSDIDIRHKINKEYLKKTGIVAGVMANIPGGEMFVTPEYVKGKIVGDVVISIDQSYPLTAKSPMVVQADAKGYKVVSGPKNVLAKLAEKKREAWKKILTYEKSGSVPKDIIAMKKRNFESIGEFAINTNPRAELSGYLIVDEKIANMIHVALGSGFEPDRATEYHTDIVIDARRQKLDIFGVAGKNTYWILKKGIFVV